MSLFILRDIFGEDCVSVKDGSVLSVTVDGKTANVNLETRVCSCFYVSRDLGNNLKAKIICDPTLNKMFLHFDISFQLFPTFFYRLCICYYV